MLNEYPIPNNDRIAYRIIDGEAVIIDLKDNTLNILNPVSTFIWERLEGQTQLKEIVRALTEEFDVDYKTAEKDCFEFIYELMNRNIIVLKSQLEEK